MLWHHSARPYSDKLTLCVYLIVTKRHNINALRLANTDETLNLIFHILLLRVWISEQKLLHALTYHFSVFRYQMKHSFWCLINYSSVFGYPIKHSFSCLIPHITSRSKGISVSGYQIKHSFSYIIHYFSVFGYQMKPQDETLLMLEMYYFSEFRYRMKHFCRVWRITC